MRMRNRSLGLTLIELCVALGIVALLAGMAVPGFRADLRAGSVRSATFELLAGLQQVHASSIIEGRTGVLCLSDAAGNCLGSGGEANAWAAYLESKGEAAGRAAPLTTRLLPAGVVLRSARAALRFWPDTLAATTGTLTICDAAGIARPRAIVLSQGGRARLTSPADSACQA
jgi:type IV fimbrial biogenesis protein FimT